MNQWVFVGHRGVGKTSLLSQLQAYFPQFHYFSLDQEISEHTQRGIQEIFRDEGEGVFRRIEQEVLTLLFEKCGDEDFIIDVGAGYSGAFPPDVKVLWLKRPIDSSQSLFLDRPKLGQKLTMPEERYFEREKRFKSISDLSLELREGLRSFQEGELLFFKALFEGHKSRLLKNYYYTVQNKDSDTEKQVLSKLGVKGFEYRDDLQTADYLEPKSEEDILSFRKFRVSEPPESGLWDWPLEWGFQPKAPITSLHKREVSFEETLKKIPKSRNIVKLAVPVHNFAELDMGHRWYLRDPEHHVFLPLSKEGRWAWYRQWMAPHFKVNFLRMGQGSAKDQPTVLNVLNQPEVANHFAAILGSPVRHSMTPTYHQQFFAEKSAPVLTIEVAEVEFKEALEFLTELGLRWAAVTSPLKLEAQKLVRAKTPINTLAYSDDQWRGTNTDAHGFEYAVEGFTDQAVAVWGGGGTLESIEEALPQAQFYSSRTGELKTTQDQKIPDILIWGVGSEKFNEKGVFPPSDWPIKRVIDLNYTQDSPGRICAYRYGCQYQSGLVMFEAQGEKQQEFWNEQGL